MAFQVVQRYNSSELRMTIVYRPWWHGCWSPKITVSRWLPRCWTLWIALRSPSYKRFTLKENDRWPVILLLHKFHVCGHFGSLGRSMTVPRHISWHGFLDSSPIPLLPGHAAFPPRRRAHSLERQKQWKLHRFLRWISMISVGKQIESSINPWTSTVWRRGRGISSRRPKTCSEL